MKDLWNPEILYLYGLARGSRHPGPDDGEIIHQPRAQEFLLYIHDGLCIYSSVTVVYSVYTTAKLLNSLLNRSQLES